MSRVTNRVFAVLLAGGLLALLGVASAETTDELRARGRKAAEPPEALDAARALRRAGFLADATNVVQRAFGKARGNDVVAELRLELARIYIEQRAQKRAIGECNQIHKLVPLKEQICIAEAQLLHRRGSAALPAAEQALALAPGDYDGLVAKGRALGQIGRPADAEAALRDAIKKAPSRPEGHRFLGELLIAQGKHEGAVAALKEGRRAVPGDPDILGALGDALPAGAEAKEALERALSVRPSFAAARARLGRVLLGMGDLDGAGKMLEQALGADARQADWHAALGEVHLAQKHPDLALKSARAALKVVANHGPAKLVEARALADKGEIDLAIQAFEDAYGLLRMDPRAPVAAAAACMRAGRLTTAKAFADRATEDFPKSASAWEVLGDVASALKDVAAAKRGYDKALAGDGPADKDGIRKKRAQLR